jgi:hypothetical protein
MSLLYQCVIEFSLPRPRYIFRISKMVYSFLISRRTSVLHRSKQLLNKKCHTHPPDKIDGMKLDPVQEFADPRKILRPAKKTRDLYPRPLPATRE